MMGRTKSKDAEPSIKRSTSQDYVLTIEQADVAARIVAHEEGGKQEIILHLSSGGLMGGSCYIRLSVIEATAVRDFLTEMLP
jgi:hypothetical protein